MCVIHNSSKTEGAGHQKDDGVPPCVAEHSLHCWHDTGGQLTSNPAQQWQICCRCGETQLIRLGGGDRGQHGPHLVNTGLRFPEEKRWRPQLDLDLKKHFTENEINDILRQRIHSEKRLIEFLDTPYPTPEAAKKGEVKNE